MVTVNSLHVVYLVKALLPQLLKRNEQTGTKAGVVITTSGAGKYVMPGNTTYSATKTFATFIAEGLNYELQGRVDVMSYAAGQVATKLLGKTKSDFATIYSDRAAQVCFRDLGNESWTRGSKKHELNLFLYMEVFPKWFLNRTIWNIMLKGYEAQKSK